MNVHSLQQPGARRRRARVALAGPLAFVLAVGALVFGVAGRAAPMPPAGVPGVVASPPPFASPASRRSALARPAPRAPSAHWGRY